MSLRRFLGRAVQTPVPTSSQSASVISHVKLQDIVLNQMYRTQVLLF
jgi:hypothetical protein